MISSYNAVTTGNKPILGEQLLGISMRRGFGALKEEPRLPHFVVTQKWYTFIGGRVKRKLW